MPGLIVHEWVAAHGGSENVVESFLEAFPEANLACLWNDSPSRFPNTKVIESPLARTPLRRHKAAALAVMPEVWQYMSLPDFDWLLISSHAFAHHAASRASKRNKKAFVYAHTPARYLWEPDLDLRSRHVAAKIGGSYLRSVDRRKVVRTAGFAANSEFVASRIGRAWDVESRVIYPPVAVRQLQSTTRWVDSLSGDEVRLVETLPKDFLLGASRFVKYKQLDAVIEAGQLMDMPVVIAGHGPEHDALQIKAAKARVPVTFIIRPSNAVLYSLYQMAAVFAFPAIEDFGIMPVEAMALGTPVVVNNQGGAAESVALTGGGVSVDWQDRRALKAAITTSLSVDMKSAAVASRQFSEEMFQETIRTWVTTP